MPKLKPADSQKLEKIVLKLEFMFERQTGSHKIFYHPDKRIVAIPMHSRKPIKVGLLNKIIKKDLKISREEFFKLLEQV